MANLFIPKTDADREIEKLIREMRAKKQAFDSKTGKLIRRIENDIQIEKHLQNVTANGLSADMARGLQSMSDAAEGIVFSEDVA